MNVKGASAMLERKPIQDISVIDIAGDIDFREMIRIKDMIGVLRSGVDDIAARHK